jgi:hypothetical protein
MTEEREPRDCEETAADDLNPESANDAADRRHQEFLKRERDHGRA